MRRMALMMDEDGDDEDVFVVTFQPPINGSTHKSTDYQDDNDNGDGDYEDDDDDS